MSEETVTLLVRYVRSFEYRNVKQHVFRNISLSITIADFEKIIKEALETDGKLKPIKNHNFDTIKIYTKSHGYKPNNLVINFDHDEELIIKDYSKTLAEVGIENETELTYFNLQEYLHFKQNPEIKW